MSFRNTGFLKIFIILPLLLNALPGKADADEIGDTRIIASIFPPYSYEENGEIKGFAVEAIRKMFTQMKISPEIEIYPWARALSMVKNTPNSLLFSVARSDDREEMFKWLGTVIDFDVHIYRKANRSDIVINSLEDLRKYSFAGLKNDIKTGYLNKWGVDVDEEAKEEYTVRMLNAGRIDLIASDKNAMNFRLEKMGFDRKDFITVLELSQLSKPLYLVANPNTADRIVDEFRRAIESVKQ